MEKHFTSTAYILWEDKVLLLLHPKFRKWLPPGGHLEANETPFEGAKREVFEETGLEIECISQENLWIKKWHVKSIERPYLCLLEEIPPHQDKPAHQHIDFIFITRPTGGTLLQDPLLRWFSLEEVLSLESNLEIFEDVKETILHLFEQQFTGLT
jgi:8-oxo-dGTP pyrophosphatase MutT (NUDIX family)